MQCNVVETCVRPRRALNVELQSIDDCDCAHLILALCAVQGDEDEGDDAVLAKMDEQWRASDGRASNG